MNQKLALRDLVSGEALRNYRRRLAGYSNPKDSVLTTKFRLTCPESDVMRAKGDFDLYRTLYDIVEGVDRGSIAYFLFSVILSGFRLFPTAGEAAVFATRAAYDEKAFARALKNVVGVELPGFTVEGVITRLKKDVRPTNGKDNRFVAEVIEREYGISLLGRKLPLDANEEAARELVKGIALELLNAGFVSWGSVKQDIPKAVAAVDRALMKKGKFPSLAQMVEKSALIPSLPEHSTIVYDPSIPMRDLHGLEGKEPHAAVAAILQYRELDDPSKAGVFIKNHLTTASASGLSWLFNKGLELFKKTSPEMLCELYCVPLTEIRRVEQIVEAAQAVPDQTLFASGKSLFGYHDFRTGFAGRIDSWTSNYIKRLQELGELVESIDEKLPMPNLTCEAGDFLSTTACRREDIETLLRGFEELRPQAGIALKYLIGAEHQNGIDDVQVVEDFASVANALFAVREQLVNALNQAEEDKKSVWKPYIPAFKKELGAWKGLVRLPKLNRLSGGVPAVVEDLKDAQARFTRTIDAIETHFTAIKSWLQSENETVDVTAYLTKVEQKRSDARKNKHLDGRELAIRILLQRLGKTVRDRRDACADELRQWFERERIFAEKKHFNQYFFNHLGAIYVSPFSRSGHQAFRLGKDVVDRAEGIWQSFEDFIDARRDRYLHEETDAGETYRRLRLLRCSIVISAISREIPGEIAALRLPESDLLEVVPAGLRLALSKSAVSASTLNRAFNCYVSLLSGAMIVLRRERFFLRTKFMWVANTTLKYVPKEKPWAMPKTRYANSVLWQRVFELDLLVEDEEGRIDTVKTFEKVLRAIDGNPDSALRELLHQLPHDWYYELPLRGEDKDREPVPALVLQKGGKTGTVMKAGTADRAVACRLVGPNSMKERIDAMLLDPRVKTGDMTLLVNQQYSQKGTNVERAGTDFELAVPLSSPVVEPKKDSKIFKRIVSIDQGEMGIAFAVFDLTDAGDVAAEPVAQGTVAIPSIRRLIKGVRRFRKGGQAVQKFNQRFDSTMFTLRENVAGDVCGAIAGLMSRYQAIPVLERDVRNLASGSKQLALVYKMVNARFVRDNIDAHRQERESWWFGAQSWTLPDLLKGIPEEFVAAKDLKQKGLIREDGKAYFPLRVYPGDCVAAKWTSRICSHCGGNISEIVAELENEERRTKKPMKISLDENGETVLKGRRIRLYARPDAKASKGARRRNERAPRLEPVKNVTLGLKEFHRLALENLRRAPKSLQTKDTSQSRYFCVFVDCKYHNREQHADVNAAINIGRRFLGNLKKKA